MQAGFEMNILHSKWCAITKLNQIAGLGLFTLFGHSKETGNEDC